MLQRKLSNHGHTKLTHKPKPRLIAITLATSTMPQIDLDKLSSLLNQHYSDDINKNRDSLYELLEAMGDLSGSLHQAKIKVKSWEYYFETLIHKILFHSYSICELSKGIDIKSDRLKNKVEIIDFPSLFILTRASLESFLTFSHIYMGDIPEEEKFFRFKLWEVSGLLARQGFDTGSSEELEKKKNFEKESILKIREEIENHPKFSELGKPQLRKLNTYGLPRVDSWNKMIEDSPLNTNFFGSIYKLFSNYAHSEYLSVLQIKQSNLNVSNSEAISNAILSMTVIRQLVCLIIEWLIKNYKSAEIISNTFPQHLNAGIKIWANIARGTENTSS